MTKRIIIVVLILLVLVGGIAFYLFNKKVESLENAEAAYSITANELYNAFEENEQAALQKYEGQIIEVSGELMDIQRAEQLINLTLEAENAMLGGVSCSFRELEKDLQVGEEVTIKGKCHGFLMNVVLSNCVLVNE